MYKKLVLAWWTVRILGFAENIQSSSPVVLPLAPLMIKHWLATSTFEKSKKKTRCLQLPSVMKKKL